MDGSGTRHPSFGGSGRRPSSAPPRPDLHRRGPHVRLYRLVVGKEPLSTVELLLHGTGAAALGTRWSCLSWGVARDGGCYFPGQLRLHNIEYFKVPSFPRETSLIERHRILRTSVFQLSLSAMNTRV